MYTYAIYLFMKIAAVADIDIKRAQNFADEFKVSKAFGCPEELAREPTVGMSFTLFFLLSK